MRKQKKTHLTLRQLKCSLFAHIFDAASGSNLLRKFDSSQAKLRAIFVCEAGNNQIPRNNNQTITNNQISITKQHGERI